MSDANVETLTAACGVTGPAAKDLLATVGGVDIPFENAMSVFRDVTLGKTTAQTASFLPNVTHLSGDSLGALVSLVYNRGASFALPGDRFIEMRQIRDDVANLRFEQVPSRIRSMKRLWENDPDARGLVKRRELEAVLFEEGLAQI
jgi:hypothetical protein